MSGLRPVAGFFIVFAAIAWVMVALSVAETTATSATPAVPEASAPGAGGGSLSGKLSRGQGVIHPPRAIDRGMAQSLPRSGSSTPVIPPLGTDGNAPDVHPK